MKHCESRFTKFFESFWTVEKHGYDKRRAYFSSEILSGQMSRLEALERISKPELSEREMQADFAYVANKLDFSVDEFEKSLKLIINLLHLLKSTGLILLGAKAMWLLGFERRLFQ